MTDRKSHIRKTIEENHAASWAILSSIPPEGWARRVYSEESADWTVRDLLAHLADSERGQVGQLQRLLQGSQTLPPDFDLQRWNRSAVAKRAGRAPEEHLSEILAAYHSGLALLESAAEADLDRVGRHARGDDLTVEAYFLRIASHRLEHSLEIQRALAGGSGRG